MKILWLSNGILSTEDSSSTGAWLDSMSEGLIDSNEVELGNISNGNVHKITRRDCGPIHQWIIPALKGPSYNGFPSRNIITSIIKIVEDFSPDLIQVWGTEGYWGLLSARNLFRWPVLLEMQGFKAAIAEVYSGGLSMRQQIACIGLKEMIRQTSIFQIKHQFERWGTYEKEMILGNHFISVHSEWMKSKVISINRNARIFRNERVIRDPFYRATPWTFSGSPILFCSAAYPAPFKGLHVAIRSVAILKDRFPNICLRIAGPHQRVGIRREGYIAWINREINRLNLGQNVIWLGSLSADQLINEFQQCSAFVLPTYIESYCVALVEAMILGVPTAVSFTGGTSFLAKDEDSALFFPAGDSEMCAYQIERLLSDSSLAERLSFRAREITMLRNDRVRVVQNQINIYRLIMSEVEGKMDSLKTSSETR